MNAVVVDSNVLLDIATEDAVWARWSIEAIRASRASGARLLIVPTIYAELSAGYPTKDALDRMVETLLLDYEETDREGLFVAGHAFKRYRHRGGKRRSPLPDFFIGGHAQVKGYSILTRDAKRYKTYFPEVAVIAPDGGRHG